MSGPAAGEGTHAWMPSSPCKTELCLPPPGGRSEAGPVRRAARWAALTAVLLTGIVCASVGRRYERAVRAWARTVVRAAGVRVRITWVCGRGEGPELLVANHISWLDVPLLAAVRPAHMVAKTEVAAYPVLGRLAARGGTVFIDRARLRTLPGTVDRIAAQLRNGASVVVFPEGSTWCGRGQGTFRPALLDRKSVV